MCNSVSNQPAPVHGSEKILETSHLRGENPPMKVHSITTPYLIIALGLIFIVLLFSAQAYANSVENVQNDMKLPPDAVPHGVETSSVLTDNMLADQKVKAEIPPPPRYLAMTALGRVYRDLSDSKNINTRIQLRRAYVLSRSTYTWSLLQKSSSVEGGSWAEDFSDSPIDPDFTYLRDGSVAIKLAHGRNLVFWPATSRVSIDPNDIADIFITAQARLIVYDPPQQNDLAAVKYLQVADEHWPSLTDSSGHIQIGYGRFKYVTAAWQDYRSTTLTAQEIGNNPPPGVPVTLSLAQVSIQFPTTPTPAGTLVVQANFDNGQIPSPWTVQAAVPSTGVTVAAAPWNTANKALKLAINKGENWEGTGYPRSQIVNAQYRLMLNRRYHFYSGFYFPAGSTFGSSNMLVGIQLHPSNNNSPYLSFTPNAGRLNIVTANTVQNNEKWMDVGALTSFTGRYVPIEIIFTPSKTNGYVAVIIDGKKVIEQTGGKTIYDIDSDGGYICQSLYDYLNQMPGTLSMYMDKTKVYLE
jgi:hypothetical protein